MHIFTAKHQKLILQVYPPGKAVDKRANPSELSYLLYYASTRRVKLEKVVTFLEAKTASDVSHNRSGNLQVTLEIISSLIEKCADNLNVFALYVCSILTSILNTKDLSLCKSVVNTYGVFCENLDGGLFSGDKAFVDLFTSLSEDLILTGSKNLQAPGPNQLEWKMIALMAIRHISPCLSHSTKIATKFINISIPFLLKTIHSTNSQSNLLSRVRSNINVEGDDRRLQRVLLSKVPQNIHKQIQEDFDNDNLLEDDITEEALRSLKALFNTTLTSQISLATRAVVKYNYESKTDLKWGATFLEMCTTWIPVQLRFVSLSTLMARLTTISSEATNSSPSFGLQTQYASHILALVSSDVNMIGLSVSDIIQQILSLQSNLILDQLLFLKPEQVKRLSSIYSGCICNLASHIYYYDQVPDAIQEILVKIDTVVDFSFVDRDQDVLQNINANNIHNLVMTLLGDVSVIFSTLTKKSSSIARNHVNLEHWEISLPLLSPESLYDNDTLRKTVFTPSQIIDIQIKYLKVLHDFLTNELSSAGNTPQPVKKNSLDPKTIESKRSSFESVNSENLNGTVKDLLKPNINQYISNPNNVISHFLLYVHKFFNFHESPNTEVVLSLISVMKDMLNILGVNFVTNFLPFLYNWLIPLNDISDVPSNAKFRDSIAHIVTYYCLKTLDDKYPDDLEGYACGSKFFSKLLRAVEYRKVNKLWIQGLDSSPTDLEIIKNTASINAVVHSSDVYENDTNSKFSFTRKDYDDFVCGNNFTIVHINPAKSLDLNGISTVVHADARGSSGSGILGPGDISNKFGGSFQGSGSTPESEVHSLIELLRHNGNSGLGYGLGTVGDISSIHSEILQNTQHLNGRNFSLTANGTFNSDITSSSILTSDGRYVNSPRVADLKDLMTDPRRGYRKTSLISDNISTSTTSHIGQTPGSVLGKQMVSTDLESILTSLNTEDDSRIIV